MDHRLDIKEPTIDWILEAEEEISNLHEEINRLSDGGHYDYKLVNRINRLQESVESAKRLLSR